MTEVAKLLLVDDEERNLEALEAILSSSDCTFVRARSADEALLALLHNEFAAIVLDIKMPGTSGLELAQLIKARKRNQHVPILFLTAHSLDEREMLLAYGVGGVDYLIKPINPAILRSKIAVFVDLFRTTRALAEAVDALHNEITERRKVEEELRVAKGELESRVLERTAQLAQANREVQDNEARLRQADRRKDEFLATLAHELRNPIAPIRYAVQVVNLQGPTTKEVRWAIEVIERQTQHMTRLIDDLLDVNRITRNSLELRKERVELSRVIRAAVETSQPMIERGGQELTVDLPNESILLDADFVRLAQVFSNLLNNAAKYGKRAETRGQIRVTARIEAKTLVVMVADSGVGISPSMLPHVFDMFTQVGRAIDQSEGGLGIGLALAKRLTEMHGGNIEARSDGPGKGSEFIVTLPFEAAVPVPAAPVPEIAVGEATGKQRILIADDNKDVAEAFEVMLQILGHEVVTAHDGMEALEKGAHFLPDVMVLDVGMPKLNGYDTARGARRESWGKDIILIAITGWGSEKDKLQSEEAGFDIHLVKPVDPISLAKLLDSLQTSKRPGKTIIQDS